MSDLFEEIRNWALVHLVVRDMPVQPPWLPGMRPYQVGDEVVTWALLENEDYEDKPFWADEDEEDD